MDNNLGEQSFQIQNQSEMVDVTQNDDSLYVDCSGDLNISADFDPLSRPDEINPSALNLPQDPLTLLHYDDDSSQFLLPNNDLQNARFMRTRSGREVKKPQYLNFFFFLFQLL